MDELAVALSFDRGLRIRAAQRTVKLADGVVVLHDGLTRLHHLNALILDRCLAGAGALVELAHEHLGHLPHRHVTVNHGRSAELLATDLLRLGWTAQRSVLMALRRAPDLPAGAPPAMEVDRECVRSVELEIDEQEELVRGWPPGAAQLIGQGLDAMCAGTTARSFAATENGRPAAACTLFTHDGVAMVDNVGTLPAHRGRGLGRAVVAAAADAALRAGCRPVLVAADADDWPQRLYGRIGFEPLGTQVSFTLWAA